MKFNELLDVQIFLSEIQDFEALKDKSVTDKFQPTDEQLKSFLKSRTPLVKKMKDHRKSADQKANWRENRYKMMKGIKAFHKSVEGKRFHKRLGRFISTRLTRTKETTNESFSTLMAKQSYLLGLNSAKQHLFVELEYFHQLEAHVELEELIIDYALPLFSRIEEKIVNDRELDDNELTFLFDITEGEELIRALSNKTGKGFAETEKLWNNIKTGLMDKGINEEDSKFYPSLVTALKKALGSKDAKKES